MNNLQKRSTLALIGLSLGLFIGVLVGLLYAYVINPIEWVDVPMELTRKDLQEDYLRMAIISYRQTKNEAEAIQRWKELGDNGPEVLVTIKSFPGSLPQDAILEFEGLISSLRDTAATSSSDCGIAQSTTDNNLCFYVWLLTMVAVSMLAVYFQYRLKETVPHSTNPLTTTSIPTLKEHIKPVGVTDHPPLTRFVTTYNMGDDIYNESFSIDRPTGEFLGECGVDIAQVLDDGPPKKISAFEIWLFDKQDIRTPALILMSEQAYQNDSLRTQLEAKGPAVLADNGAEYTVESKKLRLKVRVMDVLYSGIGTFGQCVFSHLSIDLSVWEKDEG